jgi:hypothetical protein
MTLRGGANVGVGYDESEREEREREKERTRVAFVREVEVLRVSFLVLSRCGEEKGFIWMVEFVVP